MEKNVRLSTSSAKNSGTDVMSKLNGTGVLPQVLLSLMAVVVLYIVVMSVQNFYNYYVKLSQNRVNLMKDTYSIDDNSITIDVNPNDKKSKPLALSDNERSGPEFTYSFFLNIQPNSFREEDGLLHIFSKGYPGQYPLLCPGVYMRSNTNTLRVYINTYKSWNTYCDVDNFPIGKWVHVAIVCTATHAEIYVNTNLKSRLPFGGYQPYQNYENICCFSNRRIRLPATVPSLEGSDGFNVFGTPKGFLSRLIYFNYALGFNEISSLANEGPSSTLSSKGNGISNPPPYLGDSWWTSSY